MAVRKGIFNASQFKKALKKSPELNNIVFQSQGVCINLPLSIKYIH